MRNVIKLDNGWMFAKTGTVPTALPADWEMVSLPHTWNAKDGQDGGNDYWRGTAMYAKTLALPALSDEEQIYLEVNGAAMTAEVFFNGKKLAHHEGGYSTFRVRLTGAVQGENLLCISVDNSVNDRSIPKRLTSHFMADCTAPLIW